MINCLLRERKGGIRRVKGAPDTFYFYVCTYIHTYYTALRGEKSPNPMSKESGKTLSRLRKMGID
jgi:hypothetical protein